MWPFFRSIILFLLLWLMMPGQVHLYAFPDASLPFIIITKDTDRKEPQLTDQEFYNLSTTVLFQVNRTEISEQDAFFTFYRNEVVPVMNNHHRQLRKVWIRGAASPEGSYANNQRLGRERSQALLNELQKGLLFQSPASQSDPQVQVDCVTEDYGYLCLLMEQANDPDYALVKRIYTECHGDEKCCKESLYHARNGQLWRRLLKDYFPQLRAARVVLWFAEIDPLEVAPAQPFTAPLAVAAPEARYQPIVSGQPQPRRHLLAVRTNLLHDFFYMPNYGWAPSPNIQFEYYPLNGHYTYNLGMTWGTHRRWSSQEFFQVRDFQFEVRRYMQGGGRFLGMYLGAYAQGSKYGIGLDAEKGWQGEAGGLGLTAGYVLPLNKRGNFRMEFMVAAGGLFTLFDPYVFGNPVTGQQDGWYYYDYKGSATDFKRRNHRFFWMGPTNVGIQLTYDIIYRKRK